MDSGALLVPFSPWGWDPGQEWECTQQHLFGIASCDLRHKEFLRDFKIFRMQ